MFSHAIHPAAWAWHPAWEPARHRVPGVGDDIYISGFSTGGALALKAALDHEQIKGLFLFAPALELGTWYASLLNGLMIDWVPYQRFDDRDLVKYESLTLNSVVEVGRLLAPAAILVMLGIGLFETANNMHFTYAERIGLGYGLSLLRIGEILAVATLVGIPAGLSVAWLGDRVGQLLPIVFALLLSAAALYWLMQPAGTTGYFIVMCVLSFTWAFGLPYFQAFEARLDPGGSVVVAGGFFTSGGAALGPAIAATLVRPADYSVILLVAIGIYVIVAIGMPVAARLAHIHR